MSSHDNFVVYLARVKLKGKVTERLRKYKKFQLLIIEAILPGLTRDFDYPNRENGKRYRNVFNTIMIQNGIILSAHAAFHLLLLFPLIYTCSKVVSANETLINLGITPTQEEQYITQMAAMARIGVPAFYMALAVVQNGLLYCYFKFCHQWSRLLKKKNAPPVKNNIELSDIPTLTENK